MRNILRAEDVILLCVELAIVVVEDMILLGELTIISNYFYRNRKYEF